MGSKNPTAASSWQTLEALRVTNAAMVTHMEKCPTKI